MKFNFNLFLCSMLLYTSTIHTMQPQQIPAAKMQPKAKAAPVQAAPAKAVPVKTVPAIAAPELNVPYLPELHAAAAQPEIINAWQTLYQVYQQRTSTPTNTPLTPVQVAAMAPLFETNHFAQMQKLLTPQTFPKLPNDPQGTLHTSYATFHLNKAIGRLASVASIEYNNGAPEAKFTGDNRDMGIIVNIQNNTDAQFSIIQSSVDGKVAAQIGQLTPGLNEVNLHTAALQAPANPKLKNAPSSYVFDLYEIGTNSPWLISLRMMSGLELLQTLKPISPDKPNIFLMNGQPASSEHVTNPQSTYLVLIKQAKAGSFIDTETLEAGQRIQALDISNFSGPFLITLQINPVEVDIQTPQSKKQTPQIFNQPSIVSAQIINPNQTKKTSPHFNLPLLILPQFLWNLPSMQSYWMLTTTAYLTALTEFKLFGIDSFSNAFDYFKDLECFDETKRCRVVIDNYSILKSGQTLYDAPWIIGSTLYSTKLNACPDISQIYSSQNAYNKIIANSNDAEHINCKMILKTLIQNKTKQFNFNLKYDIPYNNIYIFNILNLNSANFEVFAYVTQTNTSTYQLTLKTKNNKVIFNNFIYSKNQFFPTEIQFMCDDTNWQGSLIPTKFSTSHLNLIQHYPKKISDFKITYIASSLNNYFKLNISAISDIDKIKFTHTILFSKPLPINMLCIDAYKIRNIEQYIQLFICDNNQIPSFLASLTESNWQEGISFTTTITHQKNYDNFIITFYDSHEREIGTIIKKVNKNSIKAYNLKSSNFDPAFDIYLSTKITLKYVTP